MTSRVSALPSRLFYVDNVVEVILWAVEQGPPTGLFNVGTGQATPFKDLIEAPFAAANREPRIAYIPMPETLRGKYQYFTEASLANLHAAGYRRPFTPMRAAVAACVRYRCERRAATADCKRLSPKFDFVSVALRSRLG
jgi:nucleoside-diphosphate-sugar epimerase